MMTTAPDWPKLKKLVASLNSKEQLKLVFKFPNKAMNRRAISVADLQKAIWNLFDHGVEAIVVAHKNKVIFEYKPTLVTSNRINAAFSPTHEDLILEWKNLSKKTRGSWLNTVILESIYNENS